MSDEIDLYGDLGGDDSLDLYGDDAFGGPSSAGAGASTLAKADKADKAPAPAPTSSSSSAGTTTDPPKPSDPRLRNRPQTATTATSEAPAPAPAPARAPVVAPTAAAYQPPPAPVAAPELLQEGVMRIQTLEDIQRQSAHEHAQHHQDENDPSKIFVGGLNWETTEETLRTHFSGWGTVRDCIIMRDIATGRSRGFGFLNFESVENAEEALKVEHWIDGKLVDAKKASRGGSGPSTETRSDKIFVGGVHPDVSEDEFRDYFATFGEVLEGSLMYDRETGRPRGFGFITFASADTVDQVLIEQGRLNFYNKPVEVKRAVPRHKAPPATVRRGGSFQPPLGPSSTAPIPSYSSQITYETHDSRPAAGPVRRGGGGAGQGYGRPPAYPYGPPAPRYPPRPPTYYPGPSYQEGYYGYGGPQPYPSYYPPPRGPMQQWWGGEQGQGGQQPGSPPGNQGRYHPYSRP